MEHIHTVYITADNRVDNKTLKISSKLAIDYGLLPYKNILFHVGKLKQKFCISLIDTNINLLALSQEALNKLALLPEQNYNLKINREEIKLGPVVGIMADLNKNPDKPFGDQSFFIKQALKIGLELGELCFAFSPYNVDWKNKKIRGYTWKNDNWIKGVFPMPDVVYPRDRISNSEKIRIRKRLIRMGVFLLTSTLLDKWETHKILMQNPDIKPHLPDTRLLVDFNRQVDNMLNKYGAVYLKPINGEQGKNIVKVAKNRKTGNYEYYYTYGKQQGTGKTNNLHELYIVLKPIMTGRKYIIQKQINLIKWQKKIVDVRVLVQKSYVNIWEATGIACRLGCNGSITSNISSGGSAKKLDEVLSVNFANKEKREEIVSKIKFIAIKVAGTLESHIGSCAEMGIDLGIDKNGCVWFIEANLRPARKIFTLIGETETRYKSVENPMLYAKYLGGF